MRKIMTEISLRGFIDSVASMRLPSPLRTGRRMPPLKYPRWALTLLATAQLIIALDATIIFVALHDMGRALQINAQQLQWVVSAYTVAFGGSLLLGGRAICWAAAASTGWACCCSRWPRCWVRWRPMPRC